MRFHDVTAAHAAANASQSSLSGAWQSLLSATWTALGQKGYGGNIQDLAEALKSALSSGLSSGKNLAPVLAKAINDALDKAAQDLTSKGVSASQVAHLVTGFRRELSQAIDKLDPPAIGGPAAASGSDTGSTSGTGSASSSDSSAASGTTGASQTGASTPSVGTPAGVAGYIARERETLQITTADGDRVTIRFRQQDIIAAVSGGSQAAGSSTGGSQAAAISSGRLQISVQGSLSTDEVKAIDDLLSQVDALATQFFSGDLQGAFGAAAALNADPSQIAQFSLHLVYAQLGTGPFASAVGASTGAATATTADGGSAAGTTAAANVGAATDPTAADPAGSASPAVPTTTPITPTTTSTPTTATTPTDTSSSTNSSSSSAASPQQTIAGFIQDVLGRLGAAPGTTSFNFSMKWKLELLANALPSYAPSAQTAAAASTRFAATMIKSLS